MKTLYWAVRSLRLLVFVPWCVVVSAGIADARRMAYWSPQQLLDKSDLVVIAAPTAVNDTQERVGLPGLTSQPAIGVETKFHVLAVLKGDKALKEFALHHYRRDGAIVPNGPSLVCFEPITLSSVKQPQTVLLFLVRETDGRYAPTVGQVDPAWHGIYLLGSGKWAVLPAVRPSTPDDDKTMRGMPWVVSNEKPNPRSNEAYAKWEQGPAPTQQPMVQNVDRHTFNIDFGPSRSTPSKMVGPAAAGKTGDFWNTVGSAWDDDHTESELKWATGEPAPITVRMVNLAGTWQFDGQMGIRCQMMDDFNYPKNNQGGNAKVVLGRVPAGSYDLYIYGHGVDPTYFGDYTLTIGSRNFGRKATSNQFNGAEQKEWVEGGQYVKYSDIDVRSGEDMEILIRPGGEMSDGVRAFADAIIFGLQLVPKTETPRYEPSGPVNQGRRIRSEHNVPLLIASQGRTPQTEPSSKVSVRIISAQYPRLKVAVTNNSEQSLRFWEQWNSWGWFNLSFCAVLKDGQVVHVSAPPRGWDRNYASTAAIGPHQEWTLGVDVGDSRRFRPDDVRYISAVYCIKPTNEGAKQQVWTGVAVSPWVAPTP
jgi:hypothetical protein